MRKILQNEYFLSLSGGLLLAFSWWEKGVSLFILLGFVPFLIILDNYHKKREAGNNTLFKMLVPGFFLFYLLTFSWLSRATITGSLMAIIAHSLMAAFSLYLASLTSARSNNRLSALIFLSYWMAYEFACLHIEIISPWLNMGNVFGKNPALIQWYEYTGSGGGTLWILLCNYAIFIIIREFFANKRIKPGHIIPGIFILLCPLFFSFMLNKQKRDEEKGTVNITIVQPNIDPFTEKFDSIPFSTQFKDMLIMADSNSGNTTQWLIFPETAVDDPFYESAAAGNSYVKMARELMEKKDSINIIVGVTTARTFFMGNERVRRNSLRPVDSLGLYYELYNTAMHIGSEREISFYHKSKLVPGIEKKVNILPPVIESIIIPGLGGTMAGYGTQDTRDLFTHSITGEMVAPVVCYESAYGEFITQYIKKGAGIIAIITNDGWWDKTAGYKQHLWLASLRAIENRRPVMRSANTGISCIINASGEIVESLEWWTKGTISGSISPGHKKTFYSLYGDYLYRSFTLSGIFIFILVFVALPLRRKR